MTEYNIWAEVDFTQRINRGDLKRQIVEGRLEARGWMFQRWSDWYPVRLESEVLPYNPDKRIITFADKQFRGRGTRGYRLKDGGFGLYVNWNSILYSFRERSDWKSALIIDLEAFRAAR